MNKRIKEILSRYKSKNLGTIKNLYDILINILMLRKFAGTGDT